MHSLRHRILIFIGLLLVIACQSQIYAKQLYRWYDDNGNAYYSDQIPPKHSKYPRDKINDRGMAVHVFDGAKTKEQLAEENRLKQFRAEQQRILDEQKAHDRTLLRSFRNVEEIRSILAEKLDTVGVLITIAKSNMQKLQSQLEVQQKYAAKLEKNGSTIPKRVLTQISKSRNQIADAQNKIKDQRHVQERIRGKYQKDIDRFIELSQQAKKTKLSESIPDEQVISESSKDDIGIYLCINKTSCKSAWSGALAYVEKFSTTDIRINNEKIIHTADPHEDQDISLSVSKIPGKSSVYAKLFLDVRCKPSSIGKELCASAKVHGIRSGFRSFLSESRP